MTAVVITNTISLLLGNVVLFHCFIAFENLDFFNRIFTNFCCINCNFWNVAVSVAVAVDVVLANAFN